MAITTFHQELAGADDCPFCGNNFLFFQNGAVACDRCQCEGPFGEMHFSGATDEHHLHELKLEAVRLWNLRSPEVWETSHAD
ncbi:MAG: hypothetical protein B7Y89_06175 [Novosphingobium sp. 32-60-15]|uniref:hypothetical protein n=1 Tax=unclassified Novosphingobium TaxID=2644732 RepID=UPI000BD26BDB|nr:MULTISPECIES: hypothetical protein [unclassified Novosphingobium]OYX63139.1 MAG: hypothetical protein B7Y89_06175 [Novosphingobium sp. 32-60-15]